MRNEEGELVVGAEVGLFAELGALVGIRVGTPCKLLMEGPALDTIFQSYAVGMPDGVDPVSDEYDEGDVLGSSRYEDVLDVSRSTTGGFEIPRKARFGVLEVVSRQDKIMRNIADMFLGRQWTLLLLLNTVIR